MEVVSSLSQGRTAAAQCGLFTYKSVPVIFEPPCILNLIKTRRRYVLHISLGVTSNNSTFWNPMHVYPQHTVCTNSFIRSVLKMDMHYTSVR